MNELDNNIVAILEKINQVQRSLMWDIAKNENLSPVQMQFLIYLNKNSDELSKVSLIAKEFDLTKATVSDAISSLESKNLLKKIKEKSDKRSFVLKLTAKGKRIVKRVSHWSDIMLECISTFQEEEKKNVLVFLMELIKLMFEEKIINVPRFCITCENFQKDAVPFSKAPHKCNLAGISISDKELSIGCNNFVEKMGKSIQ